MTGDWSALSGTGEEGALSRRELLNVAWLASLGILVLEGAVIGLRFAMPRVEPGAFGGTVDLGPVDGLPPAGAAPLAFERARLWWVRTAEGALALYKVCPHLGCICDWQADQQRFVCPCHGSQFAREGTLVLGPAPRGLDRFAIRAHDAAGRLVAETGAAGDPLPVPPGATVQVDTGRRIRGRGKGR